MLKSSIVLQRAFHTALVNLARRAPRKANPGASLQLREYDDGAHEEIAEDPEGFGNLETDFMEVHQTHREHLQQLDKHKDYVRHQMVKHKYFREPHLPNLLTYAEKEQIRLLHSRDAEEWSVERLAESFPATPNIIQKLLHGKWRARSSKRIRAHDEAVIKNWERLRTNDVNSNEMQLPAELKTHLKKFAARRREDIQAANVEAFLTRPELPKPQKQEFLSIITSCSKYAKQKRRQTEAEKLPQQALRSGAKVADTQFAPTAEDLQNETYLLEKLSDKRKMRLQEFKQFKLPAEQQQEPSSSKPTLEQRAIEAFGNPSGTGILPTAVTVASSNALDYTEKFQSSEIVISSEDRKRYEISTVKNRVYIPRRLRRSGATYRVEDSYYDDDGEFLYRVPGMTGQAH